MLRDLENWQGEENCLTAGDLCSYRLASPGLPRCGG